MQITENNTENKERTWQIFLVFSFSDSCRFTFPDNGM